MDIIFVATGGAIGAVLRYFLSQFPFESAFPIATFITNLLGAFAIGVIAGLAEQNGLSESWTLLLKTGVCGGFTTFSTFSLEAVTLLTNGKYGIGTGYIIASLLCCLIGVVLGKACVKLLV